MVIITCADPAVRIFEGEVSLWISIGGHGALLQLSHPGLDQRTKNYNCRRVVVHRRARDVSNSTAVGIFARGQCRVQHMPRIDVGLGDCIGEARSASSRRGQGARHHSQTNETKFLIVNDQVADRNVSSVGNHKRVNDLITNFCSRRVTLVVATLNQSNRRTLR